MSLLVERLFAIHDALDEAGIPHAVGGAIALAFCTRDPRGTRDIDLNVFVEVDSAEKVLTSLPSAIRWDRDDLEEIQRNGQRRLMWDETPVDLFFNNLPLHTEVQRGSVTATLEGRQVPILDASALVIFKAMFDRSKDWVDIEQIAEHDWEAAADAARKLAQLIGTDDPVSIRLSHLLAEKKTQ